MTATTWNPSDKTASVTLSGGNLTATTASTAAYQGVRSTSSKSTGKVYFEITVVSVGGFSGGALYMGLASSGQSLTGQPGDSSQDGIGYTANGAGIEFNGSVDIGYNLSIANGDILCFAIDFGAKDGWVARSRSGTLGPWNNNFGGTGNPATGAFGWQHSHSANCNTVFGKDPLYIAAFCYQNSEVTLNVGNTSFAQSPPSGFSAWDAAATVFFTGAQTLQQVTQAGTLAAEDFVGAQTLQKVIQTGVFASYNFIGAQTLQKMKQQGFLINLGAPGNPAFQAAWLIGP